MRSGGGRNLSGCGGGFAAGPGRKRRAAVRTLHIAARERVRYPKLPTTRWAIGQERHGLLPKSEIRKLKSETNPKSETGASPSPCLFPIRISRFCHSDFEFVPDFGF